MYPNIIAGVIRKVSENVGPASDLFPVPSGYEISEQIVHLLVALVHNYYVQFV